MKKLLTIIVVALLLFACQTNEKYEAITTPNDVHKVEVKEVLQTKVYTYLLAKEKSTETWLAVIKMQANIGDIYYYKESLTMTNFKSKELNRSFDKVLFLDKISSSPTFNDNLPKSKENMPPMVSTGSSILMDKLNIKIKPAKGGISIASLLENKKSYAGKIITIKGQVTKFNPEIMDKNWIHIQDGTEFSNKYDLTITTNQSVNVGDIITVKGKITLNKDFGYNYFYDVMMEDAKLVK